MHVFLLRGRVEFHLTCTREGRSKDGKNVFRKTGRIVRKNGVLVACSGWDDVDRTRGHRRGGFAAGHESMPLAVPGTAALKRAHTFSLPNRQLRSPALSNVDAVVHGIFRRFGYCAPLAFSAYPSPFRYPFAITLYQPPFGFSLRIRSNLPPLSLSIYPSICPSIFLSRFLKLSLFLSSPAHFLSHLPRCLLPSHTTYE